MKTPTELATWDVLTAHQQTLNGSDLKSLFKQDLNRSSHFLLNTADISLDYSRNLITDRTLGLLCQLAEESNLSQKIKDLFEGQAVNLSENRPALHTLLRNASSPTSLQRMTEMIAAAQQKLFSFVEKIHSGQLTGTTGKSFTHIVNIGIGGSYLGPLLCTQALKDFAVAKFKFHFISSVDRAHLDDVWEQLDPETTLFIISSKSFGTIETLTNAKTIMERMRKLFGDKALHHHFAAVTAQMEKAKAFGIDSSAIFPLWDWVGGRYSIWSAIGLPLMLMIGGQQFRSFLAGAHEMDKHFQQAEFKNNMPVILGLISIWYTNFYQATARAIIPYSYRLRHLVSYLQQANMESNGKQVKNDGSTVSYATCPVIFGEEGCNGQHTYHQMLHQGTQLIPADFILIENTTNDRDTHQNILLASGLSQIEALLHGNGKDAHLLAPHQIIPGNRPCNILRINKITPHSLGNLLALYEHKIFVESVIWGINPFDQWGVELGKQLLPGILKQLQEEIA